MSERAEQLPSRSPRGLLAVAAENEAKAVLEAFGVSVGSIPVEPRRHGLTRIAVRPGACVPSGALSAWSVLELPAVDLLVTGVGKANATGALMAAAAGRLYSWAINLGIGGALPRLPAPVPIGQVVLGTLAHFADEGVQTPDGFVPLAHLGFACGINGTDSVEPDPGLVHELAPSADVLGGIATVSVCSGTDALAAQIAGRTGAIAEGMEGAGFLLAAARLGLPAAEMRVISNTTGDRTRQVWDIRTAMARLAALAVSLV